MGFHNAKKVNGDMNPGWFIYACIYIIKPIIDT